MKKSRRFLFVALFIGVTLAVPTSKAMATNWCQVCTDTDTCFACCRCNGGSGPLCLNLCMMP